MNDSLKPVFQSIKIGNRTVPNRLVAQAMEINQALPGGKVSQPILDRYRQLAFGGWGIVFVEAISVVPESIARKNGLIMTRDNIDGFKQLVSTFKAEDKNSLFIFQMSHSGRCSGPFSKVLKAYDDEMKDIPVATEKELDRIKDKFIETAFLAKEAGADGVDIKACHGYLGSELLRPANTRPDKYGGSLENRPEFFLSR